ncbi:SMP-30/gluconolactonase/LRE family protein [Sphingomonas sp. IW22]|uniref:SMP-30/gluconolactonase/LRE family protein n=1 Tax=Sphingomonas sp. IW22 TaxID=3242489 RepID=UPI003520FDF4
MKAFGFAATAIVAVVTGTAMAGQQQAPAAAPRIERLDPAFDTLLDSNAKVEELASGFSFTEGPLWHQGRLWFSDVTGDKLRTVDANGRATVVLENAGGLPNPPAGANIGPNGLAVARGGDILMAQMGARRIVRRGANGTLTPVVADYQGKRLNSPNDLVVGSDGTIWFTDPPFGLFNGMDKDPAKQLPYNAVFRYANGTLTPVITDLPLPNGIALSPDGRTLYVSNYGAPGTIYAYSIGADGSLSGKRTVFDFPKDGPGGADGMKVDSRGNIWATGPDGVWIVSPQGKALGRIRMGVQTANLAFGNDGRTLYITASKGVYRVKTKVAGLLPNNAVR